MLVARLLPARFSLMTCARSSIYRATSSAWGRRRPSVRCWVRINRWRSLTWVATCFTRTMRSSIFSRDCRGMRRSKSWMSRGTRLVVKRSVKFSWNQSNLRTSNNSNLNTIECQRSSSRSSRSAYDAQPPSKLFTSLTMRLWARTTWVWSMSSDQIRRSSSCRSEDVSICRKTPSGWVVVLMSSSFDDFLNVKLISSSCCERLKRISRMWKWFTRASCCRIRRVKSSCLICMRTELDSLRSHRKQRCCKGIWGLIDLVATRIRLTVSFTSSEFMKQLKDLEDAYLPKSDFYKLLKRFKAKYHEDLMEHYIDACSVNVVGQKQLDVHLMANHYLNRHPVK